MLEQLRGAAHFFLRQFVDVGITNGALQSIFLDGRFGMLDGEPEVEGEVCAHFAFLGQHSVVSIEMEIAECDFKGFEGHESQSQIVELAFSSASPPAVAYFLSARTTPAFQVLMVSFSSCSDSMSRITLSTGMR